MSLIPAVFLAILAAMGVIHKADCTKFIFGGEAKRVCQAYKLICPAKKVCALQSLEWPRAMKFPVCVHETHVVVKSDICRKPPIPGKCKAQFMRWYFNVHMGTCSWFTYSGCGGNQNKFRTAEECERRCMGANREEMETTHDLEEMNLTGHVRQVTNIKNSSTDENIIRVNEQNERDNKPVLITAPARAPEAIYLSSEDKTSLPLSSHLRTANKEEKRRKRKERDRLKRQKNKDKRKKKINRIKKERRLSTTEATQDLTHLGTQMGELYATSASQVGSPRFAEFRDRQMSVSRFPNSQRDGLFWMMDRQFKRRERQHRNKHKHPENVTRSDVQESISGASQDQYYEKVKLFDILKNEDKVQQI